MKRAIILPVIIGIVAAAALPLPAIERSAVVIGSRVQMHESPAGDSATVALMSEGAAVTVIDRTSGPARVEDFTDYWYRVTYRGKTGWVFGQFIALSTGGRGLARIFTKNDLVDYADHAVKNLAAVRKAGYWAALVDGANRLLADIEEISGDPVLSPYGGQLGAYRLFAACMAAEGYAGTGDIANAQKIRERLLTGNPATPLPDGTTLGGTIKDLDEMIRSGGDTTN